MLTFPNCDKKSFFKCFIIFLFIAQYPSFHSLFVVLVQAQVAAANPETWTC